MSRYSSTSAYSFNARKIDPSGMYRLSWTVDFYYPDSRLRYPRTFSRDTDQKGAERFCKKHNITLGWQK